MAAFAEVIHQLKCLDAPESLIQRSIRAMQDFCTFAVATVREACIGETIAVAVAATRLQHATDPQVRAVLATLVRDEIRHAELAWDTVQWAISAGGSAAREAVLCAFAERTLTIRDGAVAPEFGMPARELGQRYPCMFDSTCCEQFEDLCMHHGSHP